MASVQPQLIIAMKGHPCTGKTTLAMFLADQFNYPLIKQDDVRSHIPLLQQPPPSFLSTEAQHLYNLSFEVICQTALIQLSVGLSVVLDSPLSHRANLDRLLQLSSSTGACLVIVECISRDKVEWKIRLERRQQQQEEGVVVDDDDGATTWYKPSTWDDLQDVLEKLDDDYDVGDTRKLIVDTTVHVHKRVSHAVSRLSICKQSHCVDFNQWLFGGLKGLEGEEKWKPSVNEEVSQNNKEEKRPTHKHHLRFSNEVKKDGTFVCMKCLEIISSGPTYNCVFCDLFLHKSCAETPHKEELKPFPCLPFMDPTSLEYSFPETYSCRYHLDQPSKGFSYDCIDCLFETHLRLGMLPSVLRHEFHDSPLFLFMLPAAENFTFWCRACGDEGKDAFYCCIHCNVIVHINCALLPPTLDYQRHVHTLALTAHCLKDEEDFNDGIEEFICDACEGTRDPRCWVYDCAQCLFISHLGCVAPVKLNLPPISSE